MNNKLVEIVNYKKEYIKILKPIEKNRDKALLNPLFFLKEKPIIAEYKRSSPSAGKINENIDVEKQVLNYEAYGAGMVSILTDERYFDGSFDYLKKGANVLSIPVLCKDFIISKVQIDYAYTNGADAILIIAAILDDKLLVELVEYVKSLSLKVLLEIHSEEEYERVKGLDVDMLGINSRNLDTFAINKEYAASLIEKISHPFIVAESGIESSYDIKLFKKAGAKAFLIGTSLMKSKNMEQFFNELYDGIKDVC
jgi:indole-3-glycerol phosphate synthase